MRESLLSSSDAKFAIDLDYDAGCEQHKNNIHADTIQHVTGDDDSEEGDNDENDDDDEDSWYGGYYKSIRTDTGLEIGCVVTWPNCTTKEQLTISTCLPESSFAPIFHGTQWAGTRLWRAAIVGTKYLLETRSIVAVVAAPTTTKSDTITVNSYNGVIQSASTKRMSALNENSILIELGCGLGVPGMIIHAMTSCSVILTDKGDLVEQIQDNLDANFPATVVTRNNDVTDCDQVDDLKDQQQQERSTKTTIQVTSLDWSIEGVSDLVKIVQQQMSVIDGQQQPNVVILCCDCVYEPLYGTSWEQLLECQNELLRYFPAADVVTTVERRKFDGIDNYINSAQTSCSYIAHVEQINDVPFDYPPEIELYRFHGK